MSDNKGIIRDFQHALERTLHGEDIDLAGYFTEDIAWHFPRSTASKASGSDHYGRAAVLAMFSDVDTFYIAHSMRFEYHHFTAEDDRVHMHYTLRATTVSGKEYDNQYQSLFRLEQGRIAEVWEYFDTAYLFSLFAEG